MHQQLIQSNPFDLMGHQSEISSPALTLRYQLKDGSSFSRTYRFSETDAPAVQQCAAAVWDDEEFKTTGSVLFFITPEDIDSLYVEIYWYGQYEGSDEPPVYDPVNLAGITDAQKTALLQALQADLLADSAQRRYAYFEQGYEDGMEETFIRIWPRDPAPPGQGPMPAFSNCSFAVMPITPIHEPFCRKMIGFPSCWKNSRSSAGMKATGAKGKMLEVLIKNYKTFWCCYTLLTLKAMPAARYRRERYV